MRVSSEPWEPVVEAWVYTENRSAAEEVLGKLLLVLRTGFSYRDFLRVAEKWPRLRRLALAYPGLRPGRCLSLYHALVDVVVKQRVAL